MQRMGTLVASLALCMQVAGCGDDAQASPDAAADRVQLQDAPAVDSSPPDGPLTSACAPSNIKTVPAGGMTYMGDLQASATLADQTGSCVSVSGQLPAGYGQDVYKLQLGGTGKHELVVQSGRSASTVTGLNLVLVLRKDNCDSTGTEVACANGAISFESLALEVDPGTYYLEVLVDRGARPSAGTYNLAIRERELIPDGMACMQSSNTSACVRDLQCLPAAGDAGTGTTCQRPTTCAMAATDINTTTHTQTGDTTAAGSSNHFTELCDFTNAEKDQAFHLNVTQSTMFDIAVHVTPTMSSPSYTPLLTVRKGDCFLRANEKICSYQTQVGGVGVDLLDQTAGDFYVIVDGINYGAGFGMPTGAFTVEARPRLIQAPGTACLDDPSIGCGRTTTGAATGCYGGTCQAPTVALACAAATDITMLLTPMGSGRGTTVKGFTRARDPSAFNFDTTNDAGGNPCAFEPDHPERIYKLTLSGTSTIDLSTDDPETEFDTAIIVRKSDCAAAAVADCNDDIAPMPASGLPNYKSRVTLTNQTMGDYYIFVEGSFGAPSTNPPRTNDFAGEHAYGKFVLKVSVMP